jgi:hypothetical protein
LTRYKHTSPAEEEEEEEEAKKEKDTFTPPKPTNQ